MGYGKRRIIAAAVLLLTACAGRPEDIPADLSFSEGGASSVAALITNHAEITDSIRTGMKEKARAVTISFTLPVREVDEIEGLIAGWVDEALAPTGDPAEGDYLRYQYGGYNAKTTVTPQEDGYLYTVRIEPVYYSTPAQEEKVTEAVAEILQELALSPSASDEEKCAAVYDWLCTHVTYDRVHHKNPYNMIDATAFDALVYRTASCQGYCTALYRLLTELGVKCRIETGIVQDENAPGYAAAAMDTQNADTQELHAWCLAYIDGEWLLLDPTFDVGHDPYRYFLIAPEGRRKTK